MTNKIPRIKITILDDDGKCGVKCDGCKQYHTKYSILPGTVDTLSKLSEKEQIEKIREIAEELNNIEGVRFC